MKKVLKIIDEKELNEILKNKYISQKKFEDIMEKVDLTDEEREKMRTEDFLKKYTVTEYKKKWSTNDLFKIYFRWPN